MVTVRVPATTANLGPGFDCLGCALTLYHTLTFSEMSEGLVISGCDAAYQNKDNLAVQAYGAVMEELGLPMPGLSVSITGDIPASRGLGSSAAMLVAGALGANAIHGSPLRKLKLLELCNRIEGHPDNLAPALFGGLTASMVCAGKPVTVRYPLSPDLHFTALIPDFPLETKKARAVLPDTVSRQDAIYNTSHVAVLLRALELGDRQLISLALSDRLHQPYRKALIPGYDRLQKIAEECGCTAFCLSGAGPTLLCLSFTPFFDLKLAARLTEEAPNWTAVPLGVDLEGATVSGDADS